MKSISRNFLFNLVLTLSNIAFPVLTFPYVARILGPEGVGSSQFVISFAQYFVLLCWLGNPLYGTRVIAMVKNDPVALQKNFSEIFTINILTTVLASILYLLVIYNFSFFQEDLILYQLAFLMVFSSILNLDWYYSGHEDFKILTVRSVGLKVMAVIMLFLMVKDREDVPQYVLFSVFLNSAGNILNGFLIKGVKLRLSFSNLSGHFRKLLVIFATTLAISVYTVLDTIFLRFLSDDRAVGFYTAGIKISKVLIPVVVSLGAVLIPRVSQLFGDGKKDEINSITQKSFDFLCIISIPAMAALYAFAPDLMVIFSGEEYRDATIISQITSPLIFLVGLGHLFGLQLLITSNRERQYFIGVFIAMGVNIVLQFLLVPRFQETGSAICIVLTELVVSAVAWFYVYTQMQITIKGRSFFVAMISSLSVLGMAWLYHTRFTQSVPAFMLVAMCSALLYFILVIFIFKDNFCNELMNKYVGVAKRKFGKNED